MVVRVAGIRSVGVKRGGFAFSSTPARIRVLNFLGSGIPGLFNTSALGWVRRRWCRASSVGQQLSDLLASGTALHQVWSSISLADVGLGNVGLGKCRDFEP